MGTEKDCEELRNRINKQVQDMEKMGSELQTEIEDYGNISVPYRSQRQ